VKCSQAATEFPGAFGENFNIFDRCPKEGNALDVFAMLLEELPEAGYPIGALQVVLYGFEYLSIHAAIILGRSCRHLVPQAWWQPQHALRVLGRDFLGEFLCHREPL
jgi:hypothetical protein